MWFVTSIPENHSTTKMNVSWKALALDDDLMSTWTPAVAGKWTESASNLQIRLSYRACIGNRALHSLWTHNGACLTKFKRRIPDYPIMSGILQTSEKGWMIWISGRWECWDCLMLAPQNPDWSVPTAETSGIFNFPISQIFLYRRRFYFLL